MRLYFFEYLGYAGNILNEYLGVLGVIMGQWRFFVGLRMTLGEGSE